MSLEPDDLLDAIDGGWFDKQGQPISMRQWGELKYNTDDYHRVGSDVFATKGGLKVWVSTVWLGRNHNFWGGTPLIFETMTFDAAALDDDTGFLHEVTDYGDRYTTELEARLGHQEIAGQVAQDWWLDLGGRALG